LGIVLLELSESKAMEKWMKEKKDISIEECDIIDKAKYVLEWLTKDNKVTKRIQPYVQIVRLCLNCSFTTPLQIKTFIDENFREVVYRDIFSRQEFIYEMSKSPVTQ
jgi:hypothetical protein